MKNNVYSCSICGLHYTDAETAKKCYDWCSTHNSCNLEITKHSIERNRKTKKQA
jgi:hypothetical protein